MLDFNSIVDPNFQTYKVCHFVVPVDNQGPHASLDAGPHLWRSLTRKQGTSLCEADAAAAQAPIRLTQKCPSTNRH